MFVYRRGVRIVDEEIDLKKIKAGYEVDDDYVPTQEELPQVVGILDERSDEVRARQDYWENPKWKPFPSGCSEPSKTAPKFPKIEFRWKKSFSRSSNTRTRHDSDSDLSHARHKSQS